MTGFYNNNLLPENFTTRENNYIQGMQNKKDKLIHFSRKSFTNIKFVLCCVHKIQAFILNIIILELVN